MHSNRDTAIVVLSHLRWDFVYQRPQHVLSRLAKRRRVLFVEEPVFRDSAPGWERIDAHPNVTVCRCHTPLSDKGFTEDQIAFLKPLMGNVVKEKGFEKHLLWFYTPQPLAIAEALRPQAIVYDCM